MTQAEATLHAAIIASSSPVRRRDWRPDGQGHGDWFEVLPTGAADTSRLVGGPVNLDHRLEARSQVGVIESVAVRGDQIHAQLRFGSSDLARQIEADVKGKIRRQLSVGYSVTAWKRRPGKADPPTYEAAAWQALEVSVVSLGADPAARFRSTTSTRYRTMETASAAEAATIVTDTGQQDMVALERQRQSGIRSLARMVDLEAAAEVAQWLDDGTSLAEVRGLLIDLSASRQRGQQIRNQHTGSGQDWSSPQAVRSHMVDAMAHRLSGGRCALPEQSRQWRGASLADMDRALRQSRGEPAGMLGRMGGLLHSSDLPGMLQDAANKSLLTRFQQVAPALLPVARRTEAVDFKTIRRLRLGEGSALQQVNEHGEILRGTLTEKGETYQLATYAIIFGFTRNLLINDDTQALGDFISSVASKASATLGDLLTAVLTANAVMADGTALFHANHNNLGTAAAITNASLSLARVAMRAQTGPDGSLIAVTPKYLIVGPAKETEAQALLSTITPTTVADVSVFAGVLQLIVEPRLTGNQWYLAADPAQVQGLEYAELSGARNDFGTGPQVTVQTGFDVLGLEVRTIYDCGAGAVSYQGLYKNPGA